MKLLLCSVSLVLFCGFVIQTGSSPKFFGISVNQLGLIQFKVLTTTSDHYAFELEKKVNNQWVKHEAGGIQSNLAMNSTIEASVKSTTERDTLSSFFLVKFHKGINEYRIKMSYPEKIVSDSFVLDAASSNDGDGLWIYKDSIRLDSAVNFEILNNSGGTVAKGEAKVIGIKGLQKGNYFLYTKQWTKTFVVE